MHACRQAYIHTDIQAFRASGQAETETESYIHTEHIYNTHIDIQ